jgi:enoyl-CoA hydratase/3-hydroxyacyl-CoA dehydrogenase
MAYAVAGRKVQRVGIVGSGRVGPDIALFFARSLHRHGVPVIVHDPDGAALEEGRIRVQRKLREGGDSGVFKAAEAEAIARSVTFTLDRSLLVGCSLVVEAVTEDLETKKALFADLEHLVPPHAVLASNSSHLEPEAIFARLRRPERALVHHFFYPAERNPLVEIVPGPRTEVARWCADFYESLGRVPILARGRWGYAINPVFEGTLLAAMRLEEQGLSPAVIDAISCRALRTSHGPFASLDLAGANEVCRIGLEGAGERIMPWFRVPDNLLQRLASGARWRGPDRGATVSYSNAMFEDAARSLLGAYFGLACEVVESGVASRSDLELGIELGLGISPPFALMNELGPRKVRELVEGFARAQPGFRVPASFGPWTVPSLVREDRHEIAVLKLRRPRLLNALSPATFAEIGDHLETVAKDPAIRGVVITGFGVKAFSSGAELDALAASRGPEETFEIIRACQRVTRRIETLGKPVIAALNGLSLGAGSELAYACTARIARKGLPVAFGQPEVKLGLVPGAGGTQRLPRLIGFDAAWKLIRSGGSLSGAEALEKGLLSEEVEDGLVERAVQLARTMPPAPPLAPAVPPPVPSEVDLARLSRRIDEILRRAMLQGAPLGMDAALEVEARAFQEAWVTRDRQIGIEHHLRSRSSQGAPFIHQ